ncbi:MAG: acyl-CoA dehydrogenase family protein [Acidiferrobacteraceae bacterium]
MIRAGGIDERPQWTREGLAVGGGSAGLGLEMPYPQFIGPALATGVLFGDALLAVAGSESPVQEYERRLNASPEAANARWLRRWPKALHQGGAFFDRLPGVCGHFAASRDAARARRGWRARALARALADPLLLPRAWPFARALRGAAGTPGPLTVRFFTLGDGGERSLSVPAAISDAVGEIYGRRETLMEHRLGNARRHLGRLVPRLLPAAGGLALAAAAGSAALVGDAISYWRYRGALAGWLARHPYHAYETQRRMRTAAPAGADAVALVAHTDRPRPDRRHIALPPVLDTAAVHALRHVCPAGVYLGGGTLPSVHFENCIKCESCRVAVPEIDWTRTSTHRLRYRVPNPCRYGYDGAVHAELTLLAVPESFAADPGSPLARSLAARPAHVSMAWTASWRERIEAIQAPKTRERLSSWLDHGHYGWLAGELAAAPTAPPPRPEILLTAQDHAFRANVEPRLAALAADGWTDADHGMVLAYLERGERRTGEIIEWLAQWSPALAWVALAHGLARAEGGRLTVLAAPLFAGLDGAASWVPEAARALVLPGGEVWNASDFPITDRAHALDAARPVRRGVPAVPATAPSALLARLVTAFARGFVATLTQRAFDYARTRIQFAGAFQDRQGRDAIAKFGAVKAMLARLAAASELLRLAPAATSEDPAEVLNLVAVTLAPSLTGVPWSAGQIFGGMAYSEEDILAPRYRDALVMAHWPGLTPPDEARADGFAMRLARHPGASERLQAYLASRPRAASAGLRYTPKTVRSRPKARSWEPRPVSAQSGDFLHGIRLAAADVLTPEHFRRDPRLRATRAAVLRLLRSGFRSPTPTLDYGHYIDTCHGLPDPDIQRLRAFNAFATIVPESLGGKGWRKSQYAVLTRALMGRVDTSAGLLVMASTSIGTTPVLLGLEKDIPRLERALEGVKDASLNSLDAALEGVVAALTPPRARALTRRLTHAIAASKRLFLAPGSPLRYLARNYLEALFAAARCGRERDLAGLSEGITRARSELSALARELTAERERLPFRTHAHERFLAALATGEISAFALTEPSAGSDTGALQTRAVAKQVPLTRLRPGFYGFRTDDGGERVLIDAAAVQVRDRRLGYVLPDGTWAAIVQGPRGAGRSVQVGGEAVAFHDIGRVVSERGAARYLYWELTGAKMWITNGSLADRYCVYARTASGETGFMVDARSEGITVGRDERKLGQRASATNELRFERVRVDRDQVIGFIGHGQANALETLSVGRGGIVTGCATLLERLVSDYGDLAARDPATAALAHAEWQRVETLAARLVGLTDTVTPDSDFRIEAAFSKYLASEGLHRVLLAIERRAGPGSASSSSPLEKWRRDARVLNIYEGTNEVQRFLILKDLPRLLAKHAHPTGDDPVLDRALARFRDTVGPPLARLSDAVWQDPDQQVRWFAVVDWLGELYVLSALTERETVIRGWTDPADRALQDEIQCALRFTREREEAFANEVMQAFAALAAGRPDAAEETLALANAALDARETEVTQEPSLHGPARGRWVAIVRAHLRFAPEGPRFGGWQEADLAALDRVLECADGAPLEPAVLLIGPPGLEDEVRRFAAAGPEVLYLADSGAAAADEIARVIEARWPEARRFVCGADESVFAVAIAAALNARLVTRLRRLEAGRLGDWIADPPAGPQALARRLVLTLAATPSGRSDRFSVGAWLHALRQPLAPHRRPPSWTHYEPAPTPASGDEPQAFRRPEDLAEWLRRRFSAAAGEPSVACLPAVAGTTIEGHVAFVHADALAHLLRSAPFRALCDLAGPYSLVVLTQADPPSQCSQLLAHEACRGLWAWPADADTRALAPMLTRARHLIAGTDTAEAALRAAAALARPMHLGVRALSQGSLVRGLGDGLISEPLTAGAALLIDPAYTPATVPAAGTRTPSCYRMDAPRSRMRPSFTADTPAPVVLDVGFGVGDGERYQRLVEPLAAALRAAFSVRVQIGGTRRTVQDLNLIPAAAQIGQTGSRVAPDVLFALGVSGAPQHLEGIDTRSVIIAINRDPEAPIFHLPKNRYPRLIRCVGSLETWLPVLQQSLAGGDSAQGPSLSDTIAGKSPTGVRT